MDINLRRVTPADFAAIAEIYNHYVVNTDISFECTAVTAETMQARGAEALAAGGSYWVLERNQQLCGYTYARPWRPAPAYAHTFESSIYLAPGQSGHGLGYKLYGQLLEDLRTGGRVRMLFGVATLGNTASDALHEKLGFVRQAVFPDVGYKHGHWLGVCYWAYDFGARGSSILGTSAAR